MNFFSSTYKLILCFLGFASCQSAERLPQNAEKVEFFLQWSDGMGGNGSQLLLTEDSCYFKENKYNHQEGSQTEHREDFMVSAVDLDELYQKFRKQKFSSIQSYKERVHDRGGRSIELTVDGKRYYKSNAGQNFIKEKDLKRFNELFGFCNQLKHK